MKNKKLKYEDLKDGMKVTCIIVTADLTRVEIKDACISIDDTDDVYICQNKVEGSSTKNKHGYTYSWIISKRHFKDYNFKIVEPEKELVGYRDIQKTVRNGLEKIAEEIFKETGSRVSVSSGFKNGKTIFQITVDLEHTASHILQGSNLSELVSGYIKLNSVYTKLDKIRNKIEKDREIEYDLMVEYSKLIKELING